MGQWTHQLQSRPLQSTLRARQQHQVVQGRAEDGDERVVGANAVPEPPPEALVRVADLADLAVHEELAVPDPAFARRRGAAEARHDGLALRGREREAQARHAVHELGAVDLAELDGSGAVDHLAVRADEPSELQGRLDRLGVDYRERKVPTMDLFQIFLEYPNGVTIELNYFGVSA